MFKYQNIFPTMLSWKIYTTLISIILPFVSFLNVKLINKKCENMSKLVDKQRHENNKELCYFKSKIFVIDTEVSAVTLQTWSVNNMLTAFPIKLHVWGYIGCVHQQSIT